jgi:hypothetical protein
MVSSVLSPEKVVGRQNTNRAAAQNFISGGSLLGASVLNSAANKIVGFQRAGVQPAPSAAGSIVSTISTNINNNVTNTVNKTLQGFSTDYQRRVKEFDINKITTNVTNTVNKTLQGFSTDYQRRVKEFDINKITTNITNTVNKTLQGFSADYQRRVKEFDINKITTNITNTVNKTLQGFSTDYQNRIKQVDDAKPIGILGKFLNVYKTALGFINFFGNKKNIDKIRDSLDALKKSFTESFEVAKLIRQVIIKIVKQLSNLPVASPSGGGGLNLDVDIPGGGLKKSAPRGLGRMMGGGKGKMLALGAGALGLGAAGAGAVNALSDSPQAQAAGTSPEIPGDIADRFSSIVDRFANAISKLFETNKQKSNQQQQQQSSGGKGEKKEKEDKTKPPGKTGVPGEAKGVTTTGEKGVLDLIASVEQGKEGYDSFNTSAGKTPGKASEKTIGWLSKNANGAIGRYQQMPQYLLERAKRAGFDENTKFTPQVQDAITLNELKSSHGMNEFLSGKITEEQFLQKISPTWRGLPQGQINANKLGGTVDMTYQDRYAGRNAAGKKYTQTISELKNIRSGGNKPIVSATPQVAAAPTQSVAQQQIAQQVSQPPAAAQQPVVMPINLGGGGQQQTGGGGSSGGGGGGSQGSGPSVPFLPAGNPDNFLVLYSRMVYNIVDG